MAEPYESFLYLLLLLHLWTVVGGCEVQASLAPPVHLSEGGLGWTLLVCVVTDLKAGQLEIRWRSSSAQLTTNSAPVSVVGDQQDTSAVAVITVATDEWPSYSCLVTHRHHAKVPWRHHIAHADRDHKASCSHQHEDRISDAIGRWTDHVTVQVLRLLLLKSVIFNTLVTALALAPRPST